MLQLVSLIIALSDSAWMQLVDVATPQGIYTIEYGVWGTKASKRIAELSGNGFYSWPTTTWDAFCSRHFEEHQCYHPDRFAGLHHYCDGFTSICGTKMVLVQILAVSVLVLSGCLVSILLFGSRLHRMKFLYIATSLSTLIAILTSVALVIWSSIVGSFGDIPVKWMHSFSFGSSGTIKYQAESLCTSYQQNCYSFGYGLPFFVLSTLAAGLAIPVLLYAAYMTKKEKLDDDNELRDPFLSK